MKIRIMNKMRSKIKSKSRTPFCRVRGKHLTVLDLTLHPALNPLPNLNPTLNHSLALACSTRQSKLDGLLAQATSQSHLATWPNG
jgi:hypothetical protein